MLRHDQRGYQSRGTNAHEFAWVNTRQATAASESSEDHTLAPAARLFRGLGLFHDRSPELAHDASECLLDTVPRQRGRLEERAAPSVRLLAALLGRNFALQVLVNLVANEDELGCALLRAHDLVIVVFQLGEGRALHDRVDEDERVAVSAPRPASARLVLPHTPALWTHNSHPPLRGTVDVSVAGNVVPGARAAHLR
jgi:hypothetical protein